MRACMRAWVREYVRACVYECIWGCTLLTYVWPKCKLFITTNHHDLVKVDEYNISSVFQPLLWCWMYKLNIYVPFLTSSCHTSNYVTEDKTLSGFGFMYVCIFGGGWGWVFCKTKSTNKMSFTTYVNTTMFRSIIFFLLKLQLYLLVDIIQ